MVSCPFPLRCRSCAFLSRFQAPPLARQTPSLEAARPALTGGLCESVRKRPLLKPAQSGAESTALDHRQGNETKRISAVAPFAAGEPPILYRGCIPCDGGEGGRLAAIPQSRPMHPPAPPLVQRASFTPIPGRGGARNRADRQSSALSLAAAAGLIDATAFALSVGLGFNRFVTIHWAAGGVSDDLAATARWLKLAGDWIRSCGGQFAYIWIRETGPAKGAHVHILLHLPPDLAAGFNRRQRGWQTACGARWSGKVRYSRPIGRNLRHYAMGEIDGQSYEANLAETLDYVLKGADDAARERLCIVHSEPGGVIVGKRCGVSQNIGPEARRRGFTAIA